MLKYMKQIFYLSIFIFLITSTKLKAQEEVTAIQNVNVIPMTSTDLVIRNQTVLIRNGVIEAYGDNNQISVPSGAMIISGENGYLIPPNNPELMGKRILKLIQNDVLRSAFGVASHNKAIDMFQCDTMIVHLSEYFQKLAGESFRTG